MHKIRQKRALDAETAESEYSFNLDHTKSKRQESRKQASESHRNKEEFRYKLKTEISDYLYSFYYGKPVTDIYDGSTKIRKLKIGEALESYFKNSPNRTEQDGLTWKEFNRFVRECYFDEGDDDDIADNDDSSVAG